jgi:hypothetical protein
MRVQFWLLMIKLLKSRLYSYSDVVTIKLNKEDSTLCQLNPTGILSIRELLFNI